MIRQYIIAVLVSVFSINVIAADKQVVHIYLDADRTIATQSGESIERGIMVALDEVDHQLGGYSVKLMARDHRGNSKRSLSNIKAYLNDSHALAMFTGMHSPPLLANLEFINQNGILTLDPWAAAGPISRYSKGENWVFRLSVDDAKAGEVITRKAVDKEGFRKPFLLLEKTGWGRSNNKTMIRALSKRGLEPAGLEWFNWSLGINSAKSLIRRAVQNEADVIFLVANAPEGKTIVKAMIEMPEEDRLPIRSHWGITGGDFPEVIDASMREKVDLEFLQTRFSFLSPNLNGHAQGVLDRAVAKYPDIQSAEDIKSPVGFIHAYDLTRLLIQAVNEAGLSGDIAQDRARIRTALEQIQQPVQGLIKLYDKPFTTFSVNQPDAHEALGVDDMVMAIYGEKGEIQLELD